MAKSSSDGSKKTGTSESDELFYGHKAASKRTDTYTTVYDNAEKAGHTHPRDYEYKQPCTD